MKYKINTTLDALAEAWNLLQELGLSALMIPGNPLDVKPIELAQKLLGEKKLNEFIAVVSDIANPGELKLSEAGEVLTAFFTDMASELASLAGVITQVKPSKKPSKE